MDQAISVYAKEGVAMGIDFNPLTANPFQLPQE